MRCRRIIIVDTKKNVGGSVGGKQKKDTHIIKYGGASKNTKILGAHWRNKGAHTQKKNRHSLSFIKFLSAHNYNTPVKVLSY